MKNKLKELIEEFSGNIYEFADDDEPKKEELFDNIQDVVSKIGDTENLMNDITQAASILPGDVRICDKANVHNLASFLNDISSAKSDVELMYEGVFDNVEFNGSTIQELRNSGTLDPQEFEDWRRKQIMDVYEAIIFAFRKFTEK